MTKTTKLEVGDIVEQTINGSWWVMTRSRTSLHRGRCLRPGEQYQSVGSFSPFDPTQRPGSTIVVRTYDEIPDDVSVALARLALEGELDG